MQAPLFDQLHFVSLRLQQHRLRLFFFFSFFYSTPLIGQNDAILWSFGMGIEGVCVPLIHCGHNLKYSIEEHVLTLASLYCSLILSFLAARLILSLLAERLVLSFLAARSFLFLSLVSSDCPMYRYTKQHSLYEFLWHTPSLYLSTYLVSV